MRACELVHKLYVASSKAEDLLQAGLGGLRLPDGCPPVRRMQHLACVLVHVVGVARRLRSGEERKCVRRRGTGVGVGGRECGVGHLGKDDSSGDVENGME